MQKIYSALFLVGVVACSGGGSSTSSGPTPGATPGATPGSTPTPSSSTKKASWIVGAWTAPEYTDGTGPDKPPQGLGVNADGTWEHNSNGVVDGHGTWTDDGNQVKIGEDFIFRTRNCMAINYRGDWAIAEYYRDDLPAECPTQPAALTAVEKCLVGKFQSTTNYNTVSELFTTTRNDKRQQIFSQIDSGSDNFSSTTIYFWEVKDGKLCTEGVDQKSSCEAIDWNDVNSKRQGSKDPGCQEPI